MSDHIPLHYKQGDVVWVKLGFCWWPGEACEFENLPEDVREEFENKKHPLVSVKFFQEDTYQFVKNINQVYSYNCSRKDEFIRKGMDLHRAKNVSLAKFPADVVLAEKMTGGDEKILDDPKFNIIKKPAVKTPRTQHKSPSKQKGNDKAPPATYNAVTHPRFTGTNDNNVKVLMQTSIEEDEDQDKGGLDNSFKCSTCGFSSPRVDVIVLHNKSHSWENTTTPKKTKNASTGGKKSPLKKAGRVAATKTRSIDDDLALLEKGFSLTDSDEEVSDTSWEDDSKKKKKKRKRTSKGAASKSIDTNKKNKVSTIQGNILAEWDDDQDETELNSSLNSTTSDSEKNASKVIETVPSGEQEQIDSSINKMTAVEPEDTEETTKNIISNEKDDNGFEDKILSSAPAPETPSNEEKATKSAETNTEVATKLTNPKKRFVKSFEDFEQSMKEKIKDVLDADMKQTDEKNSEKVELNSKTTENSRKAHARRDSQTDHSSSSEEVVPKKVTRSAVKLGKSDEKHAKETENVGKIGKIDKIDKIECDDSQRKSKKENEETKTTEVKSYKRKLRDDANTLEETSKTEPSKIETSKTEASKTDTSKAEPFRTALDKKVDKEDVKEDSKKTDSEVVNSSKSSAKPQSKPPVKPVKETILTEIDVFGSIRAEEDEQFNKRAEESPRRETRASSSKSRSDHQDSKEKPELKQKGRRSSSFLSSKNKKNSSSKETAAEVATSPSKQSGSDGVENSESDKKVSDDSMTTVQEPVKENEAPPEPVKEDKIAQETVKENKIVQEPVKPETKVQEKCPLISNLKNKLKDMLSEPDLGIKRDVPKVAAKEEQQPIVSNAAPKENTAVEKNASNKRDFSEVHMKLDRTLINSIILPAIENAAEDKKLKIEQMSQNAKNKDSPKKTDKSQVSTSLGDLIVPPQSDKSKDKSQEKPTKIGNDAARESEAKKKEATLIATTRPETIQTKTIPTDATSKSPTRNPYFPNTSSPIILNKDFQKATAGIGKQNKIPRRVSLSSQEVTIEKVVDKVEINAPAESVVDDKPDKKMLTENVGNDELKEVADAIASTVPAINKQESDKNITVLTDSVLAQGQVEIATITEGGMEKIAPIPLAATTPIEEITLTSLIKDANVSDAEMTKVQIEKTTIADQKMKQETESTSKLLDILTDNKRTIKPARPAHQVPLPKISNPKFEIDEKQHGIVGSTAKHTTVSDSNSAATVVASARAKPTILSDNLIKSGTSEPASGNLVSVQKVKRTHDDIEDIDTFIITKHPKKATHDEEKKVKVRPKILEHTIIKSAAQVATSPKQYVPKKTTIVPPPQTTKVGNATKSVEERVYDLLNSPKSNSKDESDDTFDIDNMPIVLSDQILTAEAIESMPIVIQDSHNKPPMKKTQQIKMIGKQQSRVVNKESVAAVSPMPVRQAQFPKVASNIGKVGPRIYHSATTTILKQSPTIISQSNKPGKYIIIPSPSTTPVGSKYTVGKRQVIKKAASMVNPKMHPQVQNVLAPTSSGNKIMIVTDNQGQKSRVLLTPEQQRLMGYPMTKKIMKPTAGFQSKEKFTTGNVMHQNVLQGTSNLTTIKKMKSEPAPLRQIGQKVVSDPAQHQIKGLTGQTRTIIIKNSQGKTVRLQGTEEAALEKQVTEQLNAINRAANAKKIMSQMATKSSPQQFVKRTPKKQFSSTGSISEGTKVAHMQNKALTNIQPMTKGSPVVPPLAPISPHKKVLETSISHQMPNQKISVAPPTNKSVPVKNQQPTIKSQKPPEKPPAPTVVEATTTPRKEESVLQKDSEKTPKQLVIQDAMGNETTIVEGQILALPSETVDGQPQSYMLVTLDETGNLTPLNNEALMSLDLNLNLGGDLSNTVVQIDQNAVEESDTVLQPADESETVANKEVKVSKDTTEEIAPEVTEIAPEVSIAKSEEIPSEEVTQEVVTPAAEVPTSEVQETIQAVSYSLDKGDSQQQLFITGDPIATENFLKSLTEGNTDLTNILASAEGNILIHTDGQQILINTDADSQMLLSMSSAASDFTEQPHFTSQPASKDILAAALADTDVFQQEQSSAPAKVVPSQLSPGYPLSVVNNVLETSAMNSPIMTTQELPKSISKKLETDVLTAVPKNVDLPITITDPNIAQSVSNQQQVAPLSSELATNLDLPLTIQDVPASSELNSPSFSYSLPSLEDSEKFNSPISMPLLTENSEETINSVPHESDEASERPTNGTISHDADIVVDSESKIHESSEEYLLASGEMCAMSNQISSLSEPPPDMFEFAMDPTFDSKQCDEKPASNMMPEDNAGQIRSCTDPTLEDPEAVSSAKRSLCDIELMEDNKRSKLD